MDATTAASLVTLGIMMLFVSLIASVWWACWLLRRDISALQKDIRGISRNQQVATLEPEERVEAEGDDKQDAQEVILPEVSGFSKAEVFAALKHARRLKFSRRHMVQLPFMTRDKHKKMLRALQSQGYLNMYSLENQPPDWTDEGRLLLRSLDSLDVDRDGLRYYTIDVD